MRLGAKVIIGLVLIGAAWTLIASLVFLFGTRLIGAFAHPFYQWWSYFLYAPPNPVVTLWLRIGAGVAAREFIALRAQPRDDPLAVDQSLGTTERHEGNARRGGDGGFSQVIVGIFAHGRGLPRRGAIGNRAAG